MSKLLTAVVMMLYRHEINDCAAFSSVIMITFNFKIIGLVNNIAIDAYKLQQCPGIQYNTINVNPMYYISVFTARGIHYMPARRLVWSASPSVCSESFTKVPW